jgi:hypothetical protein
MRILMHPVGKSIAASNGSGVWISEVPSKTRSARGHGKCREGRGQHDQVSRFAGQRMM